jgi:hypothetical protein
MKNEPATSLAPEASGPHYITLKCVTTPKLGRHADGTISYKVACDMGRTALFLAITDNSSGGYFSREYVPVARTEELLAKLDQSGFPSKGLKAAFTGKSSNNAGFLAAILHAEGLLSRAADSETKHVCIGDWPKWKTSLLGLEGTPGEIGLPPVRTTGGLGTPANHKAITAKPPKARQPC